MFEKFVWMLVHRKNIGILRLDEVRGERQIVDALELSKEKKMRFELMLEFLWFANFIPMIQMALYREKS